MSEQPKLATPLARWPALIPSLLLILTALLIYIPAYSAPAHWDDTGYLVENPFVRDLRGLYIIWFRPLALWQYYPMVFTSYWVEYHLWGYNLVCYHIVNAALHGINAALLMIVLRQLKVPLAFFISLIFVCHPIHVETVVMIAERKNLLAFLFFMLAMLSYMRFANPLATRRKWAYAASLIFFIMAIQSKTVVFVFPAIMLLVEFYKTGKITWRNIWPLLPFVIVALPQAIVVRHIEHQFVGARGKSFEFTIIERILIAGRALWFYVGKIFWPYPLVLIYPRWDINTAQAWQYLFPAAFAGIVAILVGLKKYVTHTPWLLVMAFFILMAPALGFVSYYPMAFSFVSDHFVYLGSVPVIMIFILLARWLMRTFLPSAKAAQQILAVIVVIILIGLTPIQASIWHSARSMLTYNLIHNPASSIVKINLADVFTNEKDYVMATQLLLSAVESPDDYASYAYHNLGLIKSRQKDYDGAIDYFKKAVDHSPQYLSAWMNLGKHLQQQGRYEEAIVAYGHAIKIDPRIQDHFAGIAYCQWMIGNQDLALQAAKWALERDPKNPQMQDLLHTIESSRPATRPKR